ncbi:uncharacterized protein E5676_scaffold717G00120 [Cucumis melo var. makuwa]|uniref:Uncharacterized protein LOC103499218 n=2 Tax=Cucumis melo TaxID=3656 RepID=A0A1S3CCC8_CUCME|nr:uncharacterized protein LOC103499218 [Cucumis melo]KAA0055612.1 uncharacterized protein E6C27_scaffold222G00970 [Cucumis melo var. makuwa]TYK24456.1 uncharacterized protein E5676_scaffold717G00120 [Cucumis melo var. makuwa]
MAAEEILPLFDLFWFQRAIFASKPLLKTHSSAPEIHFQSSESEYAVSSSKNFPASKTAVHSANNQKLETIVSGKVRDFSVEGNNEKMKIRGKVKGLSKSLSELEFEELKGFMDLGFVFSEEDKNDTNLASIIPGLQRIGQKKEEKQKQIEDGILKRPYLSEAWEDVEKENDKKRILMKWRIPSLGATEMDIKHHLKSWAHTVASTVR